MELGFAAQSAFIKQPLTRRIIERWCSATNLLTDWIDALIVEIPLLWNCLKTGTFPYTFLQNGLGFSSGQIAGLPRFLALFAAVYILCGFTTVILRFTKKQQSLNSTTHQITNGVLMICCILFIPALIYLAKGGIHILQHEVAPCQGIHDLLRYIGEAAASIFYIVMAFCGILFTVWIPIGSALRYLKVYHLRGLPHMIFDLGTGPFLAAVWLLVTAHSQPNLYLLAVIAVILTTVVQTGGYIAEERNSPFSRKQQNK